MTIGKRFRRAGTLSLPMTIISSDTLSRRERGLIVAAELGGDWRRDVFTASRSFERCADQSAELVLAGRVDRNFIDRVRPRDVSHVVL